MTIASLTTWPPRIAHLTSKTGIVRPELHDLVIRAEKPPSARHHISVHLKKADQTEYFVILFLPGNLLDGAVDAINRQEFVTLRDVGATPI